MKKVLLSGIFAFAMILSMVFIGGVASSNNPFSVNAQQVRVAKKRKVGAIRKVYRGGKWVGSKTWDGTKWVGKKSWQGTKYVGKKTWNGTKAAGRTTKKVGSKIKRVVY